MSVNLSSGTLVNPCVLIPGKDGASVSNVSSQFRLLLFPPSRFLDATLTFSPRRLYKLLRSQLILQLRPVISTVWGPLHGLIIASEKYVTGFSLLKSVVFAVSSRHIKQASMVNRKALN